MADYRLPTFNLEMAIWLSPHGANDYPPDITPYPCQKYIPSRALLDITPTQWDLWVPPIFLRFPLGPSFGLNPAAWGITMVEMLPSLGAVYYRVRWGEVMHQGFPNQYGVLLVEQCTASTDPIVPPEIVVP